MDSQTKKVIRAAVRDAGYVAEEIVRAFPADEDGCVEVLFRGHECGRSVPEEPMTAYIRGGHASIADGW